MKKIGNELVTNEKGQALIIVLILMLVGVPLIGAVLSYAATTLKASQAFEKQVKEIYAADAGIEYGLWRILKGDDTVAETLTVNGIQVTIKVPAEDEAAISANVSKAENRIYIETWEIK